MSSIETDNLINRIKDMFIIDTALYWLMRYIIPNVNIVRIYLNDYT